MSVIRSLQSLAVEPSSPAPASRCSLWAHWHPLAASLPPPDACDARRMARIDPSELADDDEVAPGGPDQDGVASLRDTEAEAGDESELRDAFDMDDREARELG